MCDRCDDWDKLTEEQKQAPERQATQEEHSCPFQEQVHYDDEPCCNCCSFKLRHYQIVADFVSGGKDINGVPMPISREAEKRTLQRFLTMVYAAQILGSVNLDLVTMHSEPIFKPSYKQIDEKQRMRELMMP